MSFLKWVLSLPLLIAVILFALHNQDNVPVIFSPMHDTAQIPLYLICSFFLSLGFLFGTILTWISFSDLRRERRQQKKTIKKMEKEIAEHSDRIAETLAKISPGSRKSDLIPHHDQ